MIEKELAEMYLGKHIVFGWNDVNHKSNSFGKLIYVTNKAILINFYGMTQTYSLESIDWIKEKLTPDKLAQIKQLKELSDEDLDKELLRIQKKENTRNNRRKF